MSRHELHPAISKPDGLGRWGYVIGVVLLLVAVLPIALTLRQLQRDSKLKNVTAYTRREYYPAQSVLCPGDTMVFTPTLRVTLAPVIVEVTGTWWAEDEPQHTAVQSKKGDTTISIYRENREVSRRISVVVPPLPPGHYSYLRATESSSGSAPGITSVRIEVPTGCPAASTGP